MTFVRVRRARAFLKDNTKCYTDTNFIAQPKGKGQRIKSTALEVVIYKAIENVTLVFDDNEY